MNIMPLSLSKEDYYTLFRAQCALTQTNVLILYFIFYSQLPAPLCSSEQAVLKSLLPTGGKVPATNTTISFWQTGKHNGTSLGHFVVFLGDETWKKNNLFCFKMTRNPNLVLRFYLALKQFRG